MVSQLLPCIKAVHSGVNASKASPDDASGLEPVVCDVIIKPLGRNGSCQWCHHGYCTCYFCYKDGQAPPSLPVAVTVLFDHYSGPTFSDGTVPITPLRRSWSSSGIPSDYVIISAYTNGGIILYQLE